MFGPAAVFVAVFVFRWLTLDFSNDYFMHVAWAAEMLRGEWPVRDFVEPGFPLQTFLAYAGFRAGGYQLALEGAIACTFIAAGAACTYAVCRRLTLPVWLALFAVLVTVASYPRLYAYPKAFVYPAALWAIAKYIDRPSPGNLRLLAVMTGVAFWLRHDHGLWVAGAVALTLLVFHYREWKLQVAGALRYGAFTALLIAPWLTWVAASGHAGQYVAFLGGQSRGLITNRIVPMRAFEIDLSAPLVALAPIEYPIVGVRWAPDVADEDRVQREQDYRLEPIVDTPDEYRITVDRATIKTLINDPWIEDTRGINRRSGRAPGGMFAWVHLQAQRYIPPYRLRILPGAIKADNALAWLTWVTFLMPFVVLLVECGRTLRAGAGRGANEERRAAFIIPAAILGIVLYQTVVRGSPDSRLGDVAAVTAVLTAWVSWRVWLARRGHLVVKAVVLVVLALTTANTLWYGRPIMRLSAAGVDGPTNAARTFVATFVRYRERPVDVFAPPEATGLAHLAGWLQRCTEPSDRVAVIGFEPQVYVIAERGIAGGSAFFDLAWNSSEADQQLTIERWSTQQVPVVLALGSEWNAFSRDYPHVRRWVDERYELHEESMFGGNKDVGVLVERSRKRTGLDRLSNLPCFLDTPDPI